MPKCDLNFINKSLKSLRTIRLLFGILNVRVHDVIMTYDSIVALFTSVYSTEQAWYRASRTLRLRIWDIVWFYRALTELRFYIALPARGQQNNSFVSRMQRSLVTDAKSFLALLCQRKTTYHSTENGDVDIPFIFRRGSVDLSEFWRT
jgi:hypothetical protein